MVRHGPSFNRLLARTRDAHTLRFRTLKQFVILVIVILTCGYLMSLSCPSCQSLKSRCSDNCQKKIQPVKHVSDSTHSIMARRQAVMPAMVEHPGVHVVTSGSENLLTGETVVVYFFWCGERVFRFRNYISFLSAIYVIKPSKIVFLHTHDMAMDESRYNTWFQMLLETVPMLVTGNIISESDCNIDISGIVSKLFADNEESYIFIGTNTVMAEFPVHLRKSNFTIGLARIGDDDGFLYVRRQHQKSVVKSHVTNCVTKDVFDLKDDHVCIVLDNDLYPKDIWILDTPFGAFARNLVYGNPKLIQSNQEFSSLAPRIAHFFWWGTERQFHYGNYLSVLSALYVAGLERVYFHGVKPQSPLFDQLLREENVTHIYVPEYKYIHNHYMIYLTFNGDIGKLYVLSQYGGVGQDPDMFWTRRIDDELLAYDAVASFDWPPHGEFPEVFNLGVLIGKQNSFYFRALLNAMRDYRDETRNHIGMRLPYKTYELYPSTLHADRRLQVICWVGKCHPTWLSNYIQPLSNDSPGSMNFSWETDVYSVHCTWPKPPAEMVDFETLLKAEGLYADIGRNILRKSGKLWGN